MQSSGATAPQSNRLSFLQGYAAVMSEFGFVVICWKPEPDIGKGFLPGDHVDQIWGNFDAPEPLVILGPATSREFLKQWNLLIKYGYRGKRLRAPRGWLLSKVVRAGAL